MVDIHVRKGASDCVAINLGFVFPQEVTQKDFYSASLIAPYPKFPIDIAPQTLATVCVHVAVASPCVVPEREIPVTVVHAEADSSLARIVHIPPAAFALDSGLHPD